MTRVIPRRFKVNKRKAAYSVEIVTRINKGKYKGYIYPDDKLIVLARKALFNRRIGVSERFSVFWHEVTHAILADMDHHLWNNETFVNAFSDRLVTVIRSIK